ncbi:MAG: Gfo/Idh/MocA family oxidoreductase [Deltaproteobacteria bacterium]|nr:Gfo/Idh/MocA family oxidoreductase [Deltaproteobacteria bacterium]
MSKIRAAVVGLGQAGSRFDKDLPRVGIWTHVGAYLELHDSIDLVGAADILLENRTHFEERCPHIPCFSTAADMIKSVHPEIISVATPAATHQSVIEEILKFGKPKLIVCEKPLEICNENRKRIVDSCQAAGVPCIVNYTRRYSEVYQLLKKKMDDGLIGKVRSITVFNANRSLTMGSHALDLLCYLSGQLPQKWVGLNNPALFELAEPAIDFMCLFPDHVTGRILNNGFKSFRLFEVDVIGEKGRLKVPKNGERLDHIPYSQSKKFTDATSEEMPRTLYETKPADEAVYVTLVNEAAALVNHKMTPTCSCDVAYRTEALLEEILKIK